MGMTAADHEPPIARAWALAEADRLAGDHLLVQAIWALEDAVDHNTTDPGHAAERVESLIGELP